MKTSAMAVLVLCCCAPPALEERRVWTTSDFLAKQAAEVRFGGWRPSTLIAADGQLRALPAFSEGRPAAFAITEIWQAAPNPWVQPVYLANPAVRPVTRPVFPVGEHGSFYSPFWRATVVGNTSFVELKDSKQVLDLHVPLTQGDVIVCPIVPADTTVQAVHPLTQAALRPVGTRQAYVDGADVVYLAFGPDRVRATGDLLDESKLFVFVDPEGNSLPLPAVLDDDAVHRSFVRRYDVTLPVGARAFWPLSEQVPEGLAEIVGAPEAGLDSLAHRLRVATNPDCFRADAGFPASCHWLDSRSAIEASLAPSKVVRTATTATAVLLPEAP